MVWEGLASDSLTGHLLGEWPCDLHVAPFEQEEENRTDRGTRSTSAVPGLEQTQELPVLQVDTEEATLNILAVT